MPGLRLARRVALALALAALAVPGRAATPAPAAPNPTTNLLENPGFETGLAGHAWMPAAWDTSVSGLASVFFGRDTFLVHGGRYAVSIANLSTLIPMAHNWSQSFVVNKSWWGKDAVFSLWTRSNGLSGRAFMRAAVYRDTISKMSKLWGMTRERAADSLKIKPIDDPILELGWKSQYFVEPETEWVRREVRLYLPPSTNWLRLSCGLNGTGQVIFDDASLTIEAAAPPAPLPLHTNLLRDPGFEEDGTAWEYSLPPYEGLRVERDTTLSHSGRACMHYEDQGQGFNLVPTGACQTFVNRALSRKHVRLTAWLKTDSLKGTANIELYYKTVRGTKFAPAKLYSLTMDWTQLAIEDDIPPDTYEVWVWLMYESPAYGKVYFDDASFEVLGPAAEPPKPAPSSRPATRPASKRPATPRKAPGAR